MPVNKLGIFVKSPVTGEVKSRLAPPLDPGQARELYTAFLRDLFERIRQSRLVPTIFLAGERTPEVEDLVPPRWPVVPQAGADLGERLRNAFDTLLAPAGARAAIIGSDSPDLPLAHVVRAFRKLKHRDVVLGPSMDGGYYLIGLRAPSPSLLQGVEWGTPSVLARTVEAVQRAGLTLSMLPPWYDVDDAGSLALLRTLLGARRLAGVRLLPHTEAVLEAIGRKDG
jgi:uncharacterized protein